MDNETKVIEAPRQVPMLLNNMGEDYKINLAKYDDAQRQRVMKIASSVGVLDSVAVTGFGVEVQQKMNSYLDELLKGIKTADIGGAGQLTVDLAKNIKALNLTKMKEEATNGGDWKSKLPIIGKMTSAISAFQHNHEEIIKHLSEIESRAQREIGSLNAMNLKLDQLAKASLENLKELEMYLGAGQAILLRSRADFNKLRDSIADNTDMIVITQLRDQAEQINAFEARLLRMHIAFTDALTSIPQIRLNQEASRIEVRNIMDTILFDLPRLKSAIIRVASLKQIIDASKADEARRAITREIGNIGAEALDEAYTRSKQSQGNGAEDVVALASVADKLLQTIATGVKLDEENHQKREAAERQLAEIKGKLMDGLRSNAMQIANTTL